MEAVFFMGIQATGKSSFFKESFFDSHLRLNLDMLRARRRESLLLAAFIEARAKFVVDNTNPTRADRSRYITPARLAGFRVAGYYFQSALEPALDRNAAREGIARIPERGILSTYSRLEVPATDEGFDELFYVSLSPTGGFKVEEWNDEI